MAESGADKLASAAEAALRVRHHARDRIRGLAVIRHQFLVIY